MTTESNFKISATDKVLLKKIVEESACAEEEPEYLETGNIGFDLALSNGKGIPVGSSALFWAVQGVGKTTLLADVSLRLLNKAEKNDTPFKILYLAVEGSRSLMSKMGLHKFLKSKRFIYVEKSFSWRQIETLYEACLQGIGDFKDVKIIIIDSVNNVLSDQSKTKSVADGDYGTKARERANFYSKYLPRCKTAGITSFFIAQARKKQGAGLFVDDKKAAVSFADLHNVDMIFKCTAKQDNVFAKKVAIKTINGLENLSTRYILNMDSKTTDCKNRFSLGYPSRILLEKAVGAVNYYPVYLMLEANGFLRKNGSYNYFDKTLVETFGFPEKALRLPEVESCINEKMGELVAFLKEMDCYSVDVKGAEIKELSEEELEALEEQEGSEEDE